MANQSERWRNGDFATSSSPLLGAAAHRVRYAPSVADRGIALGAARVVLAWVFIYYGAGKLFGVPRTGYSRHFALLLNTAHLHPGGSFAVLAGVIESAAPSRRASASSPVLPAWQCSGHGDRQHHRHLGDRHQFRQPAAGLPTEPDPRRPGPGRGRCSAGGSASTASSLTVSRSASRLTSKQRCPTDNLLAPPPRRPRPRRPQRRGLTEPRRTI